MRDHTSEPTNKKHMPKVRIIFLNVGFNREARRHDSSSQLYIEEREKNCHPIPKNRPYENKK